MHCVLNLAGIEYIRTKNAKIKVPIEEQNDVRVTNNYVKMRCSAVNFSQLQHENRSIALH